MTVTSTPADAPASLAPPPARLVGAAVPQRQHACPDCGLFLHIPPLPRGSAARCPRCNAVLRRRRTDPHGRALALAITGLLLFMLATQLPFMDLELGGREQVTTLISGPVELSDSGLWALGVVVLATTILAPLAKLGATAWVLVAVRLPRPPRHLPALFRWVERLAPWSMLEVFLLGVFVAYTKLIDIAHVHVGLAVYALGGLMLAIAAMDAALEDEAVWNALERKGVTAGPMPPARSNPQGPRVACTCCGLVSPQRPESPRCGAWLRHRQPNSIARSWALLAAAAVLYIPANLLPVMTVVSFGQGQPDTILSGVESLAAAGMWPLAALVFFASITVPVLKLVSMTLLLVCTQKGSRWALRERTTLYRIVDSVGRWSMIDVFMVSILTALVRLGAIASVHPGPGALAFCAVVILTMLGAESFDPRLMWDAEEQP
jgi:paraquat-inducible protein A